MATAGDENHLFIDAELDRKRYNRGGRKKNSTQPLSCHDVFIKKTLRI